MCMGLEIKSLFSNKSLSDYWSNVNTVTKCSKLITAVESFLLTFLSSYIVEAGFSHADVVLTKQRNRLNLEERCDLRLKLTNLQLNINTLSDAHLTHPFHY